uniref:CCHC-type domain-containing protein n=1 Tax=Haemonchus contortus TaxID=6289 RepID=A0A7I4YJW2_HAECO
MAERGIESEEGWKDYVATMERDGEIVSDLSEMLNVNPLQIKDCVADLLRQDAGRKVAGEPLFDWSDIYGELEEAVSGGRGAEAGVPRGSVRETSGASGSPRSGPQQSNSRPSTGSRKCYACSKYGHVARDCPSRVAKVNQQIAPKEKEPSRDGRSLSSIINEARCMGMKISGKGSEESDLIGEGRVE